MAGGLQLAGACAVPDLGDATCLPCKEICPEGFTCFKESGETVGLCKRTDATDCSEAGDDSPNGAAGGAGAPTTGNEDTSSTSAATTGGATSTSSGNAATGGGGSGGNGGDKCATDATLCDPVILTPRKLPIACTGSEISIQLEASCACPVANPPNRVTWNNQSLVEGLELSDDGVLSGSPAPGTYALPFRADFDNASSVNRTFELTVLEYCTVAFATDDGGGTESYVAGADLGTGEIVWTAIEENDDGEMTSFDMAPGGDHLVQILETANEPSLELFRLGQISATPEALEYEGDYVAHAFSPDGRWLALVTTDPQEAAVELLQLVDLEPSPARLVDSIGVDYGAALTWSGAQRILFAGATGEIALSLTAIESEVVDGQLGEPRSINALSSDAEIDPILRFRVTDDGLLAETTNEATYYQRASNEVTHHPDPLGISPDTRWIATRDRNDGVRVDPIDQRDDSDSYSVAQDCTVLRAWAPDGGRILCTQTNDFIVYDTDGSRDVLSGTWLDIDDSRLWGAFRASFSADAQWLAFLPTDAGLWVLNQDELSSPPDAPVLEGNGAKAWDFFFTPRSDYLVVQRARELLVASTPDLEFEALPVTLGPAPDCTWYWPGQEDLWCGSAQVRGSPRIAPTEAHLAVRDADSQLHIVDLASRNVKSVGSLSDACTERCIQFQ